jgi:hypothetical protein
MAYCDCAAKIEEMIAKAPANIKPYIAIFQPMADACKAKSKEVYEEVERIFSND